MTIAASERSLSWEAAVMSGSTVGQYQRTISAVIARSASLFIQGPGVTVKHPGAVVNREIFAHVEWWTACYHYSPGIMV